MNRLNQVWNQGVLYTYTISKHENTITITNTRTEKSTTLSIAKPIEYRDDVRDLIDEHMI